MDADLERISRGLNVSRETEEAATMVVRGAAFGDGAATTIVPAEAATQVRGRPPTDDYFDYGQPVRFGLARLATIPGRVPSPRQLPRAAVPSRRCPLAQDACRIEAPRD